MFSLLSSLWFIRETKVILFYLYLWQLKEYRVDRFLDHFRTEKGKRLILNKIYLFKIGLFLIFLLLSIVQREISRSGREGFLKFFLGIIVILYIFEFLFFLWALSRGKLKRPVFTKKAVFLIFAGLLIEVVILFSLFDWVRDIFYFAFWLLILDVLAPAISSLIVLLMQPLTILLKNRIIKKAKIKRLQYKNLIVIGVTGSFGKTSTKEFLATILSEKFHPVKSHEAGTQPFSKRAGLFNRVKVLKTKEHQNNEMGVSQCILNDLKPDHQIFICEMGAYKRDEIKLLCDIAKPKIGILTGINEQHLALFGSQDNIVKAKFELIESLPKDGLAIFNGDNKYCQELYQKTKIKKKIIITSQRSINSTIAENVDRGDFWAENIKVEKELIEFQVFSKYGDFANFEINLLGGQNVINILLAASCAKELGMTFEEIAQAVKKIKPEQGAMKLIKGKEELNILDASYSANPDGVIANLEFLKIWPQKRIVVMPCLIELGNASKEVHYRIGKKIGEVCDLAIITTKERFEEIKKGAIEAGMKKENILFLEDPEEIFTKISIFCIAGDTVLLGGRVPNQLIELLSA